MDKSKYPINEEWINYYKTLEQIRCSGICNMWGAAPMLASWEGITQSLATSVLMSWISNYDELNKRFNWQ